MQRDRNTPPRAQGVPRGQASLQANRSPKSPVPRWAQQLTRWLDDGLRIPGTSIEIGADALLGLLLPEVGDAIGAVLSLSLFGLALRRGVPTRVLAKMLLNVALDASIGSVPLLGDVFDFAFKANRRNLNLLEAHAQEVDQPVPRRNYAFLLAAGVFVLAGVLLPIVAFGWLLGWAFSQ